MDNFLVDRENITIVRIKRVKCENVTLETFAGNNRDTRCPTSSRCINVFNDINVLIAKMLPPDSSTIIMVQNEIGLKRLPAEN